MDTTSNERPPPRERERARDGEASSIFLANQPPPGQSLVETSARLWVSVSGFALVIEEARANERGKCMRYAPIFERTASVDEAIKLYHAASMRVPVTVYITPAARACAEGIERAIDLRRRGIGVSLEPLNPNVSRRYAHEIAWADDVNGPLDRLSLPELPDYCGR